MNHTTSSQPARPPITAHKPPSLRALRAGWRERHYRLALLLADAGWRVRVRGSGLLEAICPHGVGHPTADSIRLLDDAGPKCARGTWGVHGCDGCCAALLDLERQRDAGAKAAEYQQVRHWAR